MDLSCNSKSTVSVVHLIWFQLDISYFQNFIISYHTFKSGYTHSLILLFNGCNESQIENYKRIINYYSIECKMYFKPNSQDLDAYFWILDKLESEFVVFLNSYSEILNTNWLLYLMNAICGKDIGLVGATGSYHSIFTVTKNENSLLWNKTISFNENFRKYKLIIKNYLLYFFYFKPFPNPHVRTNGFIIKRSIMRNLKFRTAKSKMDAYRFESGRKSLTAQVLKQNLKVLIIDKFGYKYEINNWPESNTFWMNEQSNLIIKDNQTTKYSMASENMKRIFSKRAWGNYA